MSVVKTNSLQLGQSLTATNNFTWYQPASPDGTVRLGNGNSGSVTDLVTLTSAGNLGIGTSSPAGKLDIRGASASSYIIDTTAGSAVSSALYLGVPSVTTYAGLVTDYANDRFYIRHNSATRMTLDSSGNLGLGVTPFTAVSGWKTLNVGNSSLGVKTATGSVNLGANATLDNKYITSNSASLYAQDLGIHTWYTAPSGTAGNAISFTQAMTLDASGNLLVGPTTTSAYLDGHLNVQATGTQPGICAKTDPAGNATQFVYSAWAPFATGNNVFMSFETETSATVRGSISYNRSLGQVAYNNTSDQRLKTNVEPSGSAIQSILDFPVDQFDWIDSRNHVSFGAVAQKAVNVIPEMVTVPANEDEMWSIDWSKAVPRLIKTVQELSAELNELKQKVNA